MIPRDPEKLSKSIYQAIEKAGDRAIISDGWAKLTTNSTHKSIYTIQEAPHRHLFPYCKAVVHHEGAGTTAAGLRAACTTLICPFGLDRSFWGSIVFDRGLGPEPIKLTELNVDNLTTALRKLNTSTEYQDNAKRMAVKINKNNAFKNILPFIESALKNPGC